jgi:GNAT superfamily N-acetyltransferase
MITRTATVDDAPAIAALVTQLGYEAAPHEVGERLVRLLARPAQRFIIAERDGRLLGWVHIEVAEFVDSDPYAHIAGLVVDRSHRRQGIGAALMAEAEAWARQQGCAVVRLRSSATRTHAHRFYAELGYTNIKTQYSFVKPLDARGDDAARRLVPRVDPEK